MQSLLPLLNLLNFEFTKTKIKQFFDLNVQIIWSPNQCQYFQSNYCPNINSYDYSLVTLTALKITH